MIPKKRPWPSLLFLLLLLWLAFWLRLYQADAFSFWTDEGLTPLRAGYDILTILSNKITIQEAITNDTHPPLFYLIIHLTRPLLGSSDFAYRYPSLLAGLLLVPLVLQLGRRLYRRQLGWLTAVFVAINPLQIWYANEARMYTLLVLLAAAATYVLWRVLQRQQAGDPRLDLQRPVTLASLRSHFSIIHYLGLYLLLAGLAVYTQYTAVFLVAGQSVFWVWLLWQRGYKKLLAGMAVAGFLLSLPLIPFTIPRLFTGAEANYYYVQPLIMLQDVVRFFQLGRSVDFEQTAVKLLNLGALGLLLLGLVGAKSNLKRAFLLVYLLAAVLGLMAGSLVFKPMYQGVRHIMIGSPAFMLLTSWGVLFASEQFAAARERHDRRWAWGLTSFAGLLILGGGSLLALNHLFFDDQFGKDDFRQMIQFIEANAGDEDIIIYNNAVLLPLHEHYQTRPDIPVTAVPVYPYGAGPGAIPQLQDFAAAYDRIWFVTDPPADGRDAGQFVRHWLDENLTPVGNFLFPAKTVEVRTLLYATDPSAANDLPDTAQPLALDWPDLPYLAGLEWDFEQPAALPALWFSLYWQGPATSADTAVRFSLQDGDGRDWWAESEHLLLPEDTTWPDSPLVRQSYHLPLPPGTPPGTYTLLAQPLATLAGEPLAPAQPLAGVTIAPSSQWPDPPQAPAPATLYFANGLSLAQIQFPAEEVRPGHNLPLTLLWATGAQPHANLEYELEVVGPDGTILRTQTDPPGARWLTEWPPNSLLRERTGLYFPPDTPPGRYKLRWQLREDGTAVGIRPYGRPWYGDQVLHGRVNVLPWPLVTEPPADIPPQPASFGSDIQLYGTSVQPASDHIGLELVWQTLTPPAGDYSVFVHLANENEEVVAQVGGIPVSGLRPSRGWRAGEFLTDSYTLPLPPDLPAGEYKVWVGLWQPETGLRLPVVVNGKEQANGRLLLHTVTIPEP